MKHGLSVVLKKALGRGVLGVLASFVLAASPASAWEPTKTVEFIVPAGTGGGADQMARFLQGVVAKHNLMKQPLVVINKPGGAGGEGFLDMKSSAGNPHKIVMTLSNLFTTPLATGIPFTYKDLTPISMLALDQFVLWVNAEAPYKSAKEYLDAIKAAPDNKFAMGGTGSKQEDQLITVALGKALGKKLTYVPFKGGGDVATQLVGAHVNSSVNNPVEAVAHWRAGKLRALCVFRGERMPQTKKVTADQAWSDIPTCKEAGIDVSYQMLRGVFLPSGASPEQVAFYVDLFQKVRALPEWKEFVENGAYDNTFMSGPAYAEWLQKTDNQHRSLMQEAGFLPQ
jgi:putative tricarboxylic transport membrane protein